MVDPEVASALAGRGRMEVSGRSVTSIVTGTATSDSADGSVMVDMGGDTVSGDGSQSVPIATTASIKEGDTVQVALSGPDGTAKGTMVIGAAGGGDRMQGEIDAVSDLPTLIRETDDGVVVGKSSDGGATYPNGYTLQSGDAFEVRDSDGDVMSSFSKSTIELGKNSSTATIKFLNGYMSIAAKTGISQPVLQFIIGQMAAGGVVFNFDTGDGTESDIGFGFVPSNTSSPGSFTVQGSTELYGSVYAAGRMRLANGLNINGDVSRTASGNSSVYYPVKLAHRVTLFSSTSGQGSGTINLSDSLANYDEITVMFGKLDNGSGGYGTQTIFSPNGKRISLNQTNYVGGAAVFQHVFSKLYCSGTTMSFEPGGAYININVGGGVSGTGTGEHYQMIYRVVGTKWL